MAELTTQLRVVAQNAVGKLATVTEKLQAAGINIQAVCAWVQGEDGHMLLVTEDNAKAWEMVKPIASVSECHEIVTVRLPNHTGALNKAAATLAEADIGINLIYASGTGDEAVIVLDTTDNPKAAALLD